MSLGKQQPLSPQISNSSPEGTIKHNISKHAF